MRYRAMKCTCLLTIDVVLLERRDDVASFFDPDEDSFLRRRRLPIASYSYVVAAQSITKGPNSNLFGDKNREGFPDTTCHYFFGVVLTARICNEGGELIVTTTYSYLVLDSTTLSEIHKSKPGCFVQEFSWDCRPTVLRHARRVGCLQNDHYYASW